MHTQPRCNGYEKTTKNDPDRLGFFGGRIWSAAGIAFLDQEEGGVEEEDSNGARLSASCWISSGCAIVPFRSDRGNKNVTFRSAKGGLFLAFIARTDHLSLGTVK